MIYLDYAATTPMSDEALDVFSKVTKSFYGNSNSMHDIGSRASSLLDSCRSELAHLLHCQQSGIYFTSGGTESNILALQSLVIQHKNKGNHLITTRCEHSSVYHLFRKLETEGFEVSYLPVDEYGVIDRKELKNTIKETTILASIQHANGEIGTIQPIELIGDILMQHDVIFHCDAIQTFGKIPINIEKAQIDSLSIASHKIYGPKGVGAVYMNPRLKWQAQMPNTSHENGFRPGTVNVPGIAAFVTSAKSACNDMIVERDRIRNLRTDLIDQMEELPSQVVIIEGHPTNYLPHIVGLRVVGIEGQYTMLECNRLGIAISTGSACQIGNQEPSRTIKALGRSDIEARQFIRLSFGKQTTAADIQYFAEALRKLTEQFFLVQGR